MYLKGGNGDKDGGGFATSNKYDKLNMCGGGGGYNKGKSIILTKDFDYDNINFPVEYVGATGGTSYIKKINLKNMSSMYDQFINTYNESDGYIVINNIK